MIKLSRFLRDYKKQVILGPIFKLIEAIFELIIPLVMAKIIDVGLKNNDTKYVLKMGGVLVMLGVIGLCCALVCQFFAAQASQGFGTSLRRELFSHINDLSYSNLDTISTSSLITRMTNDINQLQLAVAMLIRLVIRAPFLAIGSIIMAISIDLNLSIIFLLASILVSICLYLIIGKSVPFFKSIQKKLDQVSLISRENFEGNRVIRAFSTQQKEAERFNNASDDLLKTSLKVSKISSLLNPITFTIINLSIVAIVWLGGVRANIGTLTQGEIIALVNYMTQILLALIVVANLVVIFTKASASASRVNEVFKISTSFEKNNITTLSTTPKENSPKIELKNVCFSYSHSGENSLSNISFSIPSGSTIGIIGATGSGKTTLINLLPRFYDPTFGNIFIDGINIKEYPIKELRKMFGIVPQQSLLFSGTLFENLTFGYDKATKQDIEDALEVSQSYEFVNKLPQKLDTIVSKGGRNFSGGQKQRLTIARALLKKPQILILDDSSSALDYSTDSKLQGALKQILKGLTVLIISQRASSIMHADKIIVLDEGEIVGIDSHENLLKNCDIYKEICMSQENVEEAAQ